MLSKVLQKLQKQYKLILFTRRQSLLALGIAIARELRFLFSNTYHTQYEDYVRYIAKRMVSCPSMVKYIVRGFMM